MMYPFSFSLKRRPFSGLDTRNLSLSWVSSIQKIRENNFFRNLKNPSGGRIPHTVTWRLGRGRDRKFESIRQTLSDFQVPTITGLTGIPVISNPVCLIVVLLTDRFTHLSPEQVCYRDTCHFHPCILPRNTPTRSVFSSKLKTVGLVSGTNEDTTHGVVESWPCTVSSL